MKKIPISTIEALAQKFRAEKGLNESEAINLKSLLRKLNVLTVFRELSDNFYGMSVRTETPQYFILINSSMVKGRQYFTIAHEFYHLFIEENPKPHICFSENYSAEDSASEINANNFASYFLMPQAGLLKMIPEAELISRNVSIATIIKTEQYFGISRSNLLLRLKTKKLISESHYTAMKNIPVIQSARNYGYDTSLYKEGNKNLVISDFGEKARKLFDNDKISEGHYAELLNEIGYEKD